MEHVREPQLFNVTECVVESMLNEVLQQENMCPCLQCRLDVKALALNHLPPKYVVSELGKAFETYRLQGLAQSRVNVYEEILRAAQIVKERPHHKLPSHALLAAKVP